MRSVEKKKVNVLEMKYFRSLVGVSRKDRVTNEEGHRRAGTERDLASRADQRVLRLLSTWRERMSTVSLERYCWHMEVAQLNNSPLWKWHN